jgi:hypothetical protein
VSDISVFTVPGRIHPLARRDIILSDSRLVVSHSLVISPFVLAAYVFLTYLLAYIAVVPYKLCCGGKLRLGLMGIHIGSLEKQIWLLLSLLAPLSKSTLVQINPYYSIHITINHICDFG